MADAEFGEQDRGVPVGDADRRGRGDPQADEVLLQALPGRGAFRVSEVVDCGEVVGGDGATRCQGVIGVYGQYLGKVENGTLLDAGQRLAEGDPGQVNLAVVQQLDAPPG